MKIAIVTGLFAEGDVNVDAPPAPRGGALVFNILVYQIDY